jgi:predicted nucleotidyltransferase component of viral defense system
MIDEETLSVTSNYIEPYQKEKDYLEELFLAEIYGKFADQLVFKGGTAISKFYGSPRFSDDLDFSLSRRNRDPKRVDVLLNEVISKINKSYSTRILRHSTDNRMTKYEFSVRGPLFEMLRHYQHLKVEINKDDEVAEDPNIINREPGYRDIQTYVAVVMTEAEILAEKVVVLLFRATPKARDLYDLYYLLKKGNEIEVGLVDRKMHEHGHSFDEQQLNRRMATMREIWNKELKRLIPKKGFVSYEEASRTVMKGFKAANLF